VDIRYYAVWGVQGDRQWNGVHSGVATAAYYGLLGLGGNFGGLSWRRFPTADAARSGFIQEAERKRLAYPTPVPHWWWA